MIWIHGQKAGAPSRSDPRPHLTAMPRASASSASWMASAVLPIPGSPVTSATRLDPPRASARATRNSPSSADRPTKAAPGEAAPPVLTCLNVALLRGLWHCPAPWLRCGPLRPQRRSHGVVGTRGGTRAQCHRSTRAAGLLGFPSTPRRKGDLRVWGMPADGRALRADAGVRMFSALRDCYLVAAL